MTAIYKREVKSLFTTVSGYIFIAFLMLVVGIYTTVICLRGMIPQFEYVFYNVGFVFLLIVPILTMRAFAEERRQKTDQLLYSLPLSMPDIVLGKYLALLTVLAIPTLLLCFYPPILSFYGALDLFTCYSTIVALFLLGAALLAVGLFISSTTENQIVAAALSFAVMLIFYLMGDLAAYLPASAYASLVAFSAALLMLGALLYWMTKGVLVSAGLVIAGESVLLSVYFLERAWLEGAFQTAMTQLSVFDRLNTFIGGIFDLSGVVYFLSVAGLFLFFTVQSLEKRRWS